MKVKLILVLSLLMPFITSAQSVKIKRVPLQYEFGHQYRIHSKVLSEERRLLIRVPAEYYQSTTQYPVLYVLQGDVHFKHAVVSAEKIQDSGWMPESIVVAITDNEGTVTRDYKHESDNFLLFINTEVKSFMANNFRINGFSTLFGHMSSGKFVLDAFLKNPKQFDNYISANAKFRNETIDKFELFLEKNKHEDFTQALYFSMGTVVDNGSYNVEPAEKLAELLEEKAPASLQWKYQYLPLHGAYSSANVTLYDGLSDTFSEYLGQSYTYQEFLDINGMEGIKAAFRARAKKYHISDKVDVGTFMGLGFSFMDGGHPKAAVKLVSEGIRDYFPESFQLYRVLGRAYLKMNDYAQAVQAYEMMVEKAKQQNSPQLDRLQELLNVTKKQLDTPKKGKTTIKV